MRRHDFKISALKIISLALILLGVPGAIRSQGPTAADWVEEFKHYRVFFQQFEIAKALVKLHDTTVLKELEPYLSDEDRRVRGNAAFVFASLGDDRGFQVLKAILEDRSIRPHGQATRDDWSVRQQIASDRYYAVHLFGDLKDPRAVPILIPLLRDKEVAYIVPWSLGQIGDKSAIPPLIEMLDDKNPDMRVIAIDGLQRLDAKEALPKIRALLDDNERIHFDGLGPVADAAREAITKLEQRP